MKRKLSKTSNEIEHDLVHLVSNDKSLISEPLSSASFEKIPYNTKREISLSSFAINGELGSGNFGKVFRGELTGLYSSDSKTPIAIKSVQGGDHNALNDLICEIKLMSYIKPHPNLVSMIGSCRSELDAVGKIWLLIEYCEYGDLKSYLVAEKNNILSGKENDTINNHSILKWVYHVCKGMQYLSESKIMHGDLAARNVLIGENVLTNGGPVAKIADFG